MSHLFLSHLEALKILQNIHSINLRKTSMAAIFWIHVGQILFFPINHLRKKDVHVNEPYSQTTEQR